jgi:hypothetical protein
MIQTTFYNKPLSKWRGNHGKPKQCASGASCRAQSGAVAGGEVRSSDLSDRVVKRFGNIPERKSTCPNHIGSFTPENGASAKGEMGKGTEGIAASGVSENNRLGSCEAHYVSRSSPEDCSVPAGTMGKDQVAKEGCVAPEAASLTRNQQVVPNVAFPITTTHCRL